MYFFLLPNVCGNCASVFVPDWIKLKSSDPICLQFEVWLEDTSQIMCGWQESAESVVSSFFLSFCIHEPWFYAFLCTYIYVRMYCVFLWTCIVYRYCVFKYDTCIYSSKPWLWYQPSHSFVSLSTSLLNIYGAFCLTYWIFTMCCSWGRKLSWKLQWRCVH